MKPISLRTRFSVFAEVNDKDFLHLDRLPQSDPRYRKLDRLRLPQVVAGDASSDVAAVTGIKHKR